MSSTQHKKLTLLVKRFLDFFRYLFLALAVVWAGTVLIVGLNIPSEPEQRHSDINAYLSFKIISDVSTKQLATIEDGGDLLMNGTGELRLNNTRSRISWYLSGAITEILLLVFLYGLLTTRTLFGSLLEGDTFTQENVDRMKKIGYVFIGWHMLLPVLQYFGSRVMLEDIALNIPGIQLYPAFQFNIGGIFAGLAIIVLAGVLKEATGIHQEQSLTI